MEMEREGEQKQARENAPDNGARF